ncbi:MAG: dihydroorotase [Chitinophagaceae bacterium]
MQIYLIKNIQVVNEGVLEVKDILVKNGKIEKIAPDITNNVNAIIIDGAGKYLLPGLIDDQVHFREPGLTHKATIYSESKAAIAGGVTSFMEMPNTKPPALTQQLLEEKYAIASQSSLANYSFFMGVSNENAEEVLQTNKKKNEVCGIKIFMGSSTGNLLVDNYLTLNKIFSDSELLIATHCEDEEIIHENLRLLKEKKHHLDSADHPVIRNEEACFESSFKAIQLAKRYNSRLHVLHISTEKELQLFSNMLPLAEKRITAEVCVHHLHFTADDYKDCKNLIKCNPAIKAAHNKAALWKALLNDTLDIIATDHAPHEWEEKKVPYEQAHAGIPLIQHSLLLMLSYYKKGVISLEKIVQKMCHAVADCFQIKDRGYIREGYFADLVIVDLNENTSVTKDNILYKCGWSPFEGQTFPAQVTHTFINGSLVYAFDTDSKNNRFDESTKGQRLKFNR